MTNIFEEVSAAIKIQVLYPNLKSLINQIVQLKEIHGYIDFDKKNTEIEGELKQFFLCCLLQYLKKERFDYFDLNDELFQLNKLINLTELQTNYQNNKKVKEEINLTKLKNCISTAQELKKARIKCGYTRQQLSQRVGVSSQTIYYWENDKHFPKGKKLQLINRLLGRDKWK